MSFGLNGGRMRRLVDSFRYAAFSVSDKSMSVDGKFIPSKEMRQQQMQQVYENFMKRLYCNRSWSMWLTFCEVLNLANIILQIYFTNQFLGGQFLKIGHEIFYKGLEPSVDVLDVVFPKVAKCTFHKYGPSGSIQSHDAMCIMALNIINDKIYTFLWFWFLFLLIASILGTAWRLVTYCLHARSHQFNETVFSMSCPGRLNPWDVVTVTKHCSYTDWLFLYYVSKNMDGIVFRELLIGLAEELDKRNPLTRKYGENETMIKKE
ncbi:innexin inx7-like isoform X2 [Agrilus planipennis]|uniref:Innexin n=1 Tax=Agrilus planipennis TaxID=224129 RepID=A0A1W4XL94_AGRPL|nr:innexin inx7-like isoform X2 [Agrilus planipennis]